jgi:hypothetical protein
MVNGILYYHYLRHGSPEWRTVLPMAIATLGKQGGEGDENADDRQGWARGHS